MGYFEHFFADTRKGVWSLRGFQHISDILKRVGGKALSTCVCVSCDEHAFNSGV